MGQVTLVLLAAGGSSRFGLPVKKQWLAVGDKPLWLHVADRLAAMAAFDRIVIAAAPEEARFVEGMNPYRTVAGGAERQASLENALAAVESEYVLVTDVARACVPEAMVRRVLEKAGEADVVVPVLGMADTVLLGGETIDREKVKRVQTPQLSRTAVLRNALEKADRIYTDESTLVKAFGGSALYVEGAEEAAKLTFGEDAARLACLPDPSPRQLVGTGYDVHAFEEGKPMVLGGVKIDVPYGFKAHSDGDVAIHALIDALLGAAGTGDIGELFPDTDAAYENADSGELLARTCKLLASMGYVIVNADLTVMAQAPRLSPYKGAMRARLAEILGVPRARVNVKATTTEKLGFVGRKEGVAVQAAANLAFYNWKEA